MGANGYAKPRGNVLRVYVVVGGFIPHDPDYIKIGVSVDPEKRHQEIQAGVPFPVRLWGSVTPRSAAGPFPQKAELVLKDYLKRAHIAREWYDARSKESARLLEVARDPADFSDFLFELALGAKT